MIQQRKPDLLKNYHISRISTGQILGLAESIFCFSNQTWTFNLSCASIDGGILLAIPVHDFESMLENNKELKKDIMEFAKDQRKKMIDQLKYNNINNVHISLCNSSRLQQNKSLNVSRKPSTLSLLGHQNADLREEEEVDDPEEGVDIDKQKDEIKIDIQQKMKKDFQRKLHLFKFAQKRTIDINFNDMSRNSPSVKKQGCGLRALKAATHDDNQDS